MKKIINIIILMAVIPAFISSAEAQITFQKKYGGPLNENGSSVQQTFDGGYIVLGRNMYGTSGGSVFLMKTDANGDTAWTRMYNAMTSNLVSFVQQTADSGYIIGAFTCCMPTFVENMFIIKTDADGDTLWTKVIENGARNAIIRQTPDGGYILAGSRYLQSASNSLLIKISASGSIQWSKTYLHEMSFSDMQIINGGFAVIGMGTTYLGGMYLARIDSTGNVLWSKAYGRNFPFITRGYVLLSTADGGYLLAGNTLNSNQQYEPHDMYLVKTDSIGDTLWTRHYGFGLYTNTYPNSMVQTPDGGFVIAGSSASQSPPYDDYLFLIKINASGDTLWTRNFDDQGGGGFTCADIDKTADDGFIITGVAVGSSSYETIALVKTDSLGHSGCFESSTPITCRADTTIVTNVLLADSSVVIVENYPPITITGGCSMAPFCTSVGISSIVSGSEPQLTIFPNPGNGIFNLQLNNTGNDPVSVEVYDVTGRIVYSNEYGNTTHLNETIDLGETTDGVYLLKVATGDHSYERKIIVNHN